MATARNAGENIKQRLSRWLGPALNGDTYPDKVWAELLNKNSAASDTLHYRTPVVGNGALTPADSIHHGAVDVEMTRHRGAATHQTTGNAKEIDGL